MTPYYDDGTCVIYHGDCREIDAWDIAGGVMVTDPPYGMAFTAGAYCDEGTGWTSRWTGVAIAGDGGTEGRDEVLEVWSPRPALVFATWKRPLPAGTREVLVWDKVVSTGMGDLSIPWRPSWEAVCVIGTGFVGDRSHGVLRYSLPTLDPARKLHPTPKPLDLMRHLVSKCPPLAVVVDPFMGSGTTLRAAKDLGRRAIGIELEERYCEIAAKRLAQEVLDFDGAA
jgi:DNA modification methylase